MKAKIVIIGGGPTGLGAAWRLKELDDQDWLLVEGSSVPGGLASSEVDDKGFTWDLGGHVLFSHYEYFDHFFEACMEGQWVEHQREAWVWLRNQFIPYPLQNNIWRLPPTDLVPCLEGLLSVHNKAATPLRHDSFEDWIFRNFGKGLAEVFFLPYNYKVWAYHPRRLSACWIEERVATVDLGRILRNLVMREDDLGWGPNSTFRFPLHGGTGNLWTRALDRLPKQRFLLGNKVVAVAPKQKRITLADGSNIQYEYLISTMPLTSLLTLAGEDKLCHKFLHSSINLVGLGFEGSPPEALKTKCWIYFVEDQFPFHRITVFSNYSKFNVPNPGKQWSLLCEVSESSDKLINRENLKNEVLNALKGIGLVTDKDVIASIWQRHLEFGYPIPFPERDMVLEQVEEMLTQMNIFSRGRFGAWKYEVSNQDHSFMQGVELIDRILFGTEEATYRFPSLINGNKKSKNRRAPLPRLEHQST